MRGLMRSDVMFARGLGEVRLQLTDVSISVIKPILSSIIIPSDSSSTKLLHKFYLKE